MIDDVMQFEEACQALLQEGKTDEAERLVVPVLSKALLQYAQIAMARGAWGEAVERWSALRAIARTDSRTYLHGANALNKLGRTDDADILLYEGCEHAPGDDKLFGDWAENAARRADFAESARRWKIVSDKFPSDVGAFGRYLRMLVRAGKEAGEEGALSPGDVMVAPTDIVLALEYGWLAIYHQDWEVAVARWERIRQLFPEEAAGYSGGALALRALGRTDDADALIRAGIRRLPNNPDLAFECAWLAHTAGDWQDAVRRWEIVREHLPDHAEGYLLGAIALNHLGRFDEVDAVAEEAALRFPSHGCLLTGFAELISARNDHASPMP